MESQDIVSKVREIVEPPATENGAIVEDVVFRAKSNPPSLAIIVESAKLDQSLNSDQVADLARQISKALDADDPFSTEYTLEVSTPGAEAALTAERHYRRNIGRIIRVRLKDGQKLEGTLTDVSSDGIIFDYEGKTMDLPFDEIRSARAVAQVPKEG